LLPFIVNQLETFVRNSEQLSKVTLTVIEQSEPT